MFLLVQNDVYHVNIRKDNLETVSLFSFESLALFTKSSRMVGVMQRAVFKVMGPKNLFLSRLSPTKPCTGNVGYQSVKHISIRRQAVEGVSCGTATV